MNTLNTLREVELKDCVRNGAVKRLNIVQGGSGKYRVVVNLTWKEGDLNLVTTRKTIREWASLDNLARLIQTKYGIPPLITLSLQQEETTNV
ncbi:MAG: hypothetical protein LBU46_03885 [Candidatus Accumulibacter sp.]|nr:hypothetical protein [Accumulibacter sp.]